MKKNIIHLGLYSKPDIAQLDWYKHTKKPLVLYAPAEGFGICDLPALPDDLGDKDITLITGNLSEQPESPIKVLATPIAALSKLSTWKWHQTPAGPVNRHFLCLNRSDRESRRMLVEYLFRHKLNEFGEISYLEKYDTPLWEGSRFIDGGLGKINTDGLPIRDFGFNIVNESTNDTDGWNCLFVSENTVKALVSGRLSVFWATEGHVKMLRNMGLDVFEDLIDHSYDRLEHQERFTAVCHEIERLIKIPLHKWKVDFQARTASNAKKILSLYEDELEKVLEVVGKLPKTPEEPVDLR